MKKIPKKTTTKKVATKKTITTKKVAAKKVFRETRESSKKNKGTRDGGPRKS